MFSTIFEWFMGLGVVMKGLVIACALMVVPWVFGAVVMLFTFLFGLVNMMFEKKK